ncbi:hypothetical protein [Mangrovimonas cancribranchiae]|uniref:Glycosyltransferase RgtA/B/C/D-like domain-containing protein n=1 Tax=Mangrovimonas cancribranchiae TaxID=3080055 RepID=A0AAU6P4N6_9FLAO
MILKKLYTSILKSPLKFLLIYSVLIRLFLVYTYQSVTIFPDSEDYITLAKYISNWSLQGYTGERTPGFPALLALYGNSQKITVLCQLLLGLANMYFLFQLSFKQTQRKDIAFWVTFVFGSFINIVFFEFAILTETLTLTLLLLSFWFISKYHLLSQKASIKHLGVLSVIYSALYLTRPMFIYLPLGFFLYRLVLLWNIKSIYKTLIVIVFPALVFYGWNTLNKKNIGLFTSSYYLGFNLAQTATSFFHLVPDEDYVIRDIFVKHRNNVEENEPDHVYPMSVWKAHDELLEETQLTRVELSQELKRISIDLFKKHPDLYLKQVLISWKDFWGSTESLLWNVSKFQNKPVRKALIGFWIYFQKYLLITINILFLVFGFKKLWSFIKHKHMDFDLFLVAIVLSGSLAQALVAYGSNSRFCIPFFPLIVYFVIYSIFTSKFIARLYANSTSS